MTFAIPYGIGATAFLFLLVLMLVNRIPRGIGIRMLAVGSLTFCWCIAAAVQSWWLPGAAHVLETVSTAAWILVMASLLRSDANSASRQVAFLVPVAAGIGIGCVANDLRFLSSALPAVFASSQVLSRVVLAVCGILTIENLYRNTSAEHRWHLLPFCIALGAFFSYDLFVFCEAVVLRGADPGLVAAQGIVLALIVPLLALTMARNPGWRIDVHVSRNAVFHGATFAAAGVFLLVSAGAASLIGRLPSQWAVISEAAFFFGSIVLLMTVLSAGSFRSRVKRLIAENFFSARYDYRVEWLRSIATLSGADNAEPLAVRAIRAIADVVDSPGGALWLQNEEENYFVEQTFNFAIDRMAREPQSSAFVSAFGAGDVVQQFGGNGTGCKPEWGVRSTAWLAIPLTRTKRLIGFIVLAAPRAPASLNWESFDLLLAIAQQVAAFLAEEKATRALTESRSLIEYSKKFSFLVHDIKNISGQLALMVANIKAFGDRPEFRSDLTHGLENTVKQLDRILERSRPGKAKQMDPETSDANLIAQNVMKQFDGGKVQVCCRPLAQMALVRISPSALRSVLTHLIKNAVEASAVAGTVAVVLNREDRRIVIEVSDTGCGMSNEFVRDGLFTPLFSTKVRGHGIGAFQARELVRAADGDIQVKSAVGEGTVMRVILWAATDNAVLGPSGCLAS